jgi:hypothetical protein
MRAHEEMPAPSIDSHWVHTELSSPADWPLGERIFPGQLKFFRFMTDHQAFALAQRILHLVYTDFDFQ